MTYDIWVEIYWAVFYVLRDWSWTISGILVILAVLRPIKKYAFAQPITIDKEFMYSSFIARILWRAFIRIGWEKYKDKVRNPYGAHLYGSGVDIGITAILIPILSFFWPVFAIILIGVYPLQAMHIHYARKKEFMAKLKGEYHQPGAV